MKKYIHADFREDRKAALERGRAKRDARKTNKSSQIIDQIKNAEKPMEEAFDLLVPSSGAADTKAGELIRAIGRIMYRDSNDGDVFYEGYGIETCGDAVAFLCDKMPELEDKFESIAWRNFTDSNYTHAIEDIADDVLKHIYDNPDLVTEANTEDMFDADGEQFIKDHEWEPEYETDINIPSNLQYHLDKGHISDQDLQWEIESWDWHNHSENGEANVDYGYINFQHLNRDTYDEIESDMYNWLEQYGEDLDEEYGSEDDEYDEDEE